MAKTYPVCTETDKAKIVAWARQFKRRNPDYPLTPHPIGYWCKKVAGKQHRFGKLADPEAALEKWLDQKEDLQAGRQPATEADGVTVRSLAKRYLAASLQRVNDGEIGHTTYRIYKRAVDESCDVLGDRLVSSLQPDDFAKLRKAIAEHLTGHGLKAAITFTRAMFKYGVENHIIDQPRYGTEFKIPGQKALRRLAADKPEKFFDRQQILTMLDRDKIAGYFQRNRVAWRAMILMAVNCGFSSIDISEIPAAVVDLDAGRFQFQRPKTLVDRPGILWPETCAAIREYLKVKPHAKRGHGWRLFINSAGSPWIKQGTADSTRTDVITITFRRYLQRLGFYTRGCNFGTFRHTFATIGSETGERYALERLLGHVADGITERHYIEFVSDDRLKRVTDHVRKWLFRSRCDQCGRHYHAWKPHRCEE